jgi:hypothetical protein
VSGWLTSFAEMVIQCDCDDDTNNCQDNHKNHHKGFPFLKREISTYKVYAPTRCYARKATLLRKYYFISLDLLFELR